MKKEIMDIKAENSKQIVALEKDMSEGSCRDLNSDQEESFTDSTEKEPC